jgi:CheY-like chemotaxis protein
VDDSLTKKIEGTGLGLSISQKLAQMLDTEIKVLSPNPRLNNSERPGSLFYFTVEMPLTQRKEIELLELEEVTKSVSASTSDTIKTSNILIVEDNVINQKVLARILKRYDIYPDIAADWKECLSQVDKKNYDIILMDLQMPEVSGFDLTKILRDRGISSSIVAVTGNALDEYRKKATEVGMNGFLTKPLKVKDIEDILGKFL